MYSVTDRHSFEHLNEIRNSILSSHNATSFPMILVGNKTDLHEQREISTQQGKAFFLSFLLQSSHDKINPSSLALALTPKSHYIYLFYNKFLLGGGAGQELAAKWAIPFFEISAKADASTVDLLFVQLIKEIQGYADNDEDWQW